MKSCKYNGVSYTKARRRWIACIHYKNRIFHLGSYKDPESAARAYDKAAIKYRGEKAKLNFPLEKVEVKQNDLPTL